MLVVHPFRWWPHSIILSCVYADGWTGLCAHGKFYLSLGKVCCQLHWQYTIFVALISSLVSFVCWRFPVVFMYLWAIENGGQPLWSAKGFLFPGVTVYIRSRFSGYTESASQSEVNHKTVVWAVVSLACGPHDQPTIAAWAFMRIL